MPVEGYGGGPHRISPKAQALVRRLNQRNQPAGKVTYTGAPIPKHLTYTGQTLVNGKPLNPISPDTAKVFARGTKLYAQIAARLKAEGNPHPAKVDQANIHMDPLQENAFAPKALLQAALPVTQDWATAAFNIPAGLTYTAEHPVSAAKGMVKGFAQDVEHPLRHPGFTLLDAFAALSAGASAAARGAAAAGELGAEGSLAARAGRAAAAVARKPVMPERSLVVPGENGSQLTVHPLPARNPVVRAGQALKDARYNKALGNPDDALHGTALKAVANEVNAHSRQAEMIARSPGEAAISAGHKLSKPEQQALFAHAEGTTPAERVVFHQRLAAESTNKAARQQHLYLAKLNEKAGKLMLPDGKLPPHLQAAYDTAAEAANARDVIRAGAGRDAVPGRVNKPAEIITGDTTRQGRIRVPYTSKTRTVSGRPVFSPPSVGIPRAPGSEVHQFTGGLLKSGKFRTDFTRLVGESHLEAQRYYGRTLRIRDQLVQASHALPRQAKDGTLQDIPVRLDKLKNKTFPTIVKQAKGEEVHYGPEDIARLEHEHDNFLRETFPNPDAMTVEETAAFHKLQAEGKVAWVDKRLAGKLVQAAPRPGGPIRALAGANNLVKGGMLYLKPSYAIPNIAGNAALNIVHQGAFAPINLGRAFRLSKHLGPEHLSRIDAAMGEGVAGALKDNVGIAHRAVNAGAEKWGKVVDRVFRRAAFIHEARLAGAKTPEQLKQFLTDPAHQERLATAARRANKEIIDYGNLTPAEQQYVRHFVFLYPWVKGSTQYAAHFALEHPVQHAAAIQLGREGKQWSQKTLGPVPSYLEGSFKVHGKLVNPSSAAILGTPAQVAEAISGTVAGRVPEAAQLQGFLPPVQQALLEIATRKDSLGRDIPPGQDVASTLGHTLAQQLPLATLVRRIQQAKKPEGAKLFHYSVPSAVEQFTAGSIAPRSYNPDTLHAQALKEQESLMNPGDKIKFRTAQAVSAIPAQLKAATKANPKLSEAFKTHPDFVGKLEKAYQRDADYQNALLQAKNTKGSKLDALDRLRVVMTLAQKYGFSKDSVKTLTDRLAQLEKRTDIPDSLKQKQYSQAASLIWRQYGMRDYISTWKNQVLPYAH